MTRSLRALILLVVLALSACGFHLRGSDPKETSFAFKSLYVKAPSETPFVIALRRMLVSSKIALAPSADQADLVLEVVSEAATKQILSLNSAGRVQEFQLFYRVSLRAYDSKQVDWLPPDEISLSRIMAYDDALALPKQQEEAMLFTDMRNDAVGQVLRRLNRAKPQP